VIRGVYIAATGMLAETQRQDVIANNLANATTTGFRRSVTASTPFAQTLLSNMQAMGAPPIGTLSRGAQLESATMLQTQGALRSTGNPLDLALVGSGYFAVDSPAGRRYTRDGSFTLAADGTVSQGGAVRGRLLITALAPGSVTSEGGSRLNGTPAGADGTRVRQGHLEASAVNVVSEMVELIRTMRSFEANQKAAQSHDEALQLSVGRVGRMG
jgi:flagellar basal-body rod protein FlgF